jgi:glycosyltransferase involved in cell wall biosynthesis
MRVLHVIPSLSAIDGGPTEALGVMEQALVAEGIVVETAATDDDGPGRRMGKPSLIAEKGITRRYFRKNTDLYKISWSFLSWITRHVRRYDLVHIHALFSFTSNAAAWTARRAGVPYVVRPLGVLNEYGLMKRRPWLKGLSLQLIEGPIIEHASAMHFTSRAECRQAEGLGYAMRSKVIPLALPSLDLPAAPASAGLMPALIGKKIVLFLSRLDPKKNVEGLLTAFAQERARMQGTVLVIAGSGGAQYVNGLKALVQRLGIAADVMWTGDVRGVTKAELLRAATVFVLPSYSENFGLSVAEALAAGVPCIVGQGVALAEDVMRADAGLCVTPDPASIGEALRQMLSSAERRATMATNARALAEAEFSSAIMGRRLRLLYEEILKAGSK